MTQLGNTDPWLGIAMLVVGVQFTLKLLQLLTWLRFLVCLDQLQPSLCSASSSFKSAGDLSHGNV